MGVRPVVVLALAGLVVLVVALLTGSTPMAILVIVLAAIGIVLLTRHWRDERRHVAGQESGLRLAEESGAGSAGSDMKADELSPDISGDPDGPSSDARAD